MGCDHRGGHAVRAGRCPSWSGRDDACPLPSGDHVAAHSRQGSWNNRTTGPRRPVSSIARSTPAPSASRMSASSIRGSDFPVINGLSFSVKPGEKGRHHRPYRLGQDHDRPVLLDGLYLPTSGRVLIDGVDIRQYHNGGSPGRRWRLAGQSSELFSGTVKEIPPDWGRADATRRRVWLEVAKMTGVRSLRRQPAARLRICRVG